MALGWTFVFGMVYMPPFFIPVLLLITLIALPSAGVVASKTGGWSKLAKVYPDVVSYVGEEVVCSGGMGIANYGFSLLLGGNYTGIYACSLMKLSVWMASADHFACSGYSLTRRSSGHSAGSRPDGARYSSGTIS